MDGRHTITIACASITRAGWMVIIRAYEIVCVCVAQTRREMSVAGSDERMLSDHQVKSAEI